MKIYARNKLESVIVSTTVENKEYLKDELKAILESDKSYQSKCDYLGYSISSLDTTIAFIDEQIKELQAYKKRLKSAKDLVLTTGAEIFNEYGISKLDGAGISSITTSKETINSKLEFTILNEQALIDGGFCKRILNMELLEDSYNIGNYVEFIEANTQIQRVIVTKPSKLKVNKRRSVNNTDISKLSDAA